MSKGTIAALAIGIALGLATLDMTRISWLPANPVIAAFQEALGLLLLPGLICSAFASGNIHAYSLATGGVFNAAVYFGLVKLIVWIATRRRC